jgi:hypothetical protein
MLHVIIGKIFQPVEYRIDYLADRHKRDTVVLFGRGISFMKLRRKGMKE